MTGRAPVGSGSAPSEKGIAFIMAIRSLTHMTYLRWILPIIVLLILATVLVLGPALFTHAAGTGVIAPAATPAATHPAVSPNSYWGN